MTKDYDPLDKQSTTFSPIDEALEVAEQHQSQQDDEACDSCAI